MHSLKLVAFVARAEVRQLLRAPLIIALSILEAITFIVLVTLFGLTGSNAPTAVINNDHGVLSASLIQHMKDAHHSFAIKEMTREQADKALSHGRLSAVVTIPSGFTTDVQSGKTVVIPVEVDNLDRDLTDDIERAVPSAVTKFGLDNGFAGIHAVAAEHDLHPQDTSFIHFLVVNALAVNAFVVAGILGAVMATREWEERTILQWTLAPLSPFVAVAGKIAASTLVSGITLIVVDATALLAYRIPVANWPASIGVILVCAFVFSSIGVCLGAALRRTIVVAPLVFGLTLPMFILSGGDDPERFDGEKLWHWAHISPAYYLIGSLQYTVHHYYVTPESIIANLFIALLFALCAMTLAGLLMEGGVSTRWSRGRNAVVEDVQ